MTEKIADRKSWDVFSHRNPTHLELIWIEFKNYKLSDNSLIFSKNKPILALNRQVIIRSLNLKRFALLAQKSHFRFIAAD